MDRQRGRGRGGLEGKGIKAQRARDNGDYNLASMFSARERGEMGRGESGTRSRGTQLRAEVR